MPEKMYFPKLAGLFVIGLVTLLISGVMFILMLPYLLTVAVSTVLLAFAFIALFVAVYACLLVGAVVYYFFRPMQWEKEDKGYSLSSAKATEAGMRQKGKKKKTEPAPKR